MHVDVHSLKIKIEFFNNHHEWHLYIYLLTSLSIVLLNVELLQLLDTYCRRLSPLPSFPLPGQLLYMFNVDKHS